MLKFFRIWMVVLGVLLGLQFLLAGYGVYGGGSIGDDFQLHILNGRLIAVVTLLGILFAAFARAGGRLVGLAAILFGMTLLQGVIVLISTEGTVAGQVIFMLHVANGIGMMEVTGKAQGLAKKKLAERVEGAEPAAEPAAA